MLVKTADSSLTDTEKITAAILRDWHAVDVETGAHLSRSRGRSRYGSDPKWYLILPHDGNLFDSSNGCERAVFRAPDLNEAVAIASEKLPKLMKRMEKRRT